MGPKESTEGTYSPYMRLIFSGIWNNKCVEIFKNEDDNTYALVVNYKYYSSGYKSFQDCFLCEKIWEEDYD